MRKILALILTIVIGLCSVCASAENVEADRNLFTVEVTFPSDLADEDFQEKWGIRADEGKCKSVTVNEDGSVTIIMSKKQHAIMLDEMKITIDEAMANLATSTEETAFVSVEANESYTEFYATLSTDSVGMTEFFSVFVFFIFGRTYNMLVGTPDATITVSFINQATGEIMETFNSDEM